MGAPKSWSNETNNVKVGVIDTGIDLGHPDFKENIKGSYNVISNKRSGNDDNGHGTHIEFALDKFSYQRNIRYFELFSAD